MQPSNEHAQPNSMRTKDTVLPNNPQAAASVGLPNGDLEHGALEPNGTINTLPTAKGNLLKEFGGKNNMKLELHDGTVCLGVNFGARRSVAGELVFQTGMVGYPESITDPSYRGQILVITFPLMGNYGVPSRETMDETLRDLPAHFESTQIHISGLVVASYCGEDYSHHLATSSLGTWLKEQNVPAIYGVDTRSLTKRIRKEGSMLGRLLVERSEVGGTVNGQLQEKQATNESVYEHVEWTDPNTRNLVADGESVIPIESSLDRALTIVASLHSGASPILPANKICAAASVRSCFKGLVC